MSRKCVEHVWERSHKKTVHEVCKACGEEFPCQDLCGHLDCEEAYGKPPTCYECGKRLKGNVRHYIELRGQKLMPVHEKCTDTIALDLVIKPK